MHIISLTHTAIIPIVAAMYSTLFSLIDQGELSVAMDLCEQEGYCIPLARQPDLYYVVNSSYCFTCYSAYIRLEIGSRSWPVRHNYYELMPVYSDYSRFH